MKTLIRWNVLPLALIFSLPSGAIKGAFADSGGNLNQNDYQTELAGTANCPDLSGRYFVHDNQTDCTSSGSFSDYFFVHPQFEAEIAGFEMGEAGDTLEISQSGCTAIHLHWTGPHSWESPADWDLQIPTHSVINHHKITVSWRKGKLLVTGAGTDGTILAGNCLSSNLTFESLPNGDLELTSNESEWGHFLIAPISERNRSRCKLTRAQ